MIKLSRFSRLRRSVDHQDGAPIWVNPNKIITLESYDTSILTDENQKLDVSQRELASFTQIYFSGGGDVTLDLQVRETPQEILNKISGVSE